MEGIKIYENKIDNKIENMLKTNSDYLSNYYNYICNKQSLNTSYLYLGNVIRFIHKINKPVEELILDDFTSFLAQYRNKTSSYQRNIFFSLKSFSSYLKASGKISDDYMEKVTAPKKIDSLQTIQKRSKGYLEPNEIEQFINAVKNGSGNKQARSRQLKWRERDVAIMYLFLTTGMRISALYKLDIGNIDWQSNLIITIEKGNKIRSYYLSEQTLKALKIWIKKRKILLGDKEETALFISNQLNRIDISSISNLVKKYSADINGKHITPHKLRATYGTQLYKETRDIKFVQDRMGHANPQTTELYIRYDQTEDKQKAADIMSKFLND